jgi:hypothetical protein
MGAGGIDIDQSIGAGWLPFCLDKKRDDRSNQSGPGFPKRAVAIAALIHINAAGSKAVYASD